MKQGVLTPGRVALLMTPGDSCFRGFGRRSGERRRKSVRGCIVSQDLSVLNLAIVKKGGILQQYCFDKDLLIQHRLVTMSSSSGLCKVLLCALCIAAVCLHQRLIKYVHIKLLRMWLHQCSRLDCMCLIGRLLMRRSWRDSWADRHRQAAHAWPQACIQDPQALQSEQGRRCAQVCQHIQDCEGEGWKEAQQSTQNSAPGHPSHPAAEEASPRYQARAHQQGAQSLLVSVK